MATTTEARRVMTSPYVELQERDADRRRLARTIQVASSSRMSDRHALTIADAVLDRYEIRRR